MGNERTEEQVFSDTASRIGEAFTDYLLVARTKDGMAFRCSDINWSLGAAERFIEEVRTKDFINAVEEEDEPG